jgi:hypothetical protein
LFFWPAFRAPDGFSALAASLVCCQSRSWRIAGLKLTCRRARLYLATNSSEANRH